MRFYFREIWTMTTEAAVNVPDVVQTLRIDEELASLAESAKRERTGKRRNVLLIVAVLIQGLSALQFGWFFLTVPIGGLLVLIASVLDLTIRRRPGSRLWPLATLVVGGAATLGAAWGAAFIGSLLGHGFSRGRQLRVGGKAIYPDLVASDAWCGVVSVQNTLNLIPAEARGALAKRWRENGKTEYASVGAFARLTTDLMALGAPPSLIADSNRDALDEIRHTERCFALARALDGLAEGPAAFLVPERSPASSLRREKLASLAVDSLFDGALHEGLSARVLAALTKRCEIAPIAATLKELAADEGRHAAHAWDVIDFCIDEAKEDRDFVTAALVAAAKALPEHFESDLPAPAKDGDWERWGIHGTTLETECYVATLAHLRARISRITAANRQLAA
jgi:hypothetical protein